MDCGDIFHCRTGHVSDTPLEGTLEFSCCAPLVRNYCDKFSPAQNKRNLVEIYKKCLQDSETKQQHFATLQYSNNTSLSQQSCVSLSSLSSLRSLQQRTQQPPPPPHRTLHASRSPALAALVLLGFVVVTWCASKTTK